VSVSPSHSIVVTLDGDEGGGAGADRVAVQEHCTGPALPDAAPELGADQPAALTEDPEEVDSVLFHLRPPPYPYEIDRELAARGREIFESRSAGCSGCHGVYDGAGGVDWPGVHRDVGTDPARRDLVSPSSWRPPITVPWWPRARCDGAPGTRRPP